MVRTLLAGLGQPRASHENVWGKDRRGLGPLRAAQHLVQRLAQKLVDRADGAQFVIEEGQRSLIGAADFVIQPVQILLNAAQLIQALQIALESRLGAANVATRQALHVPFQQPLALFRLGVDLLDCLQNLLTLGQRVLSRAKFLVVADEDFGNIVLEKAAHVLRSARLRPDGGHEVAHVGARIAYVHQQVAALLSRLAQQVAAGLAL